MDVLPDTLVPDLAPKALRERSITALRLRDGDICMHPDCGKPLDFSISDDKDPFFVTIDHWMPKHECSRRGWTHEQKWADENLKLMHKTCNAKKGDLIPNDDGTLPEKKSKREFRYRRDKRAQRPEICTSCNAGRNLDENEWCNACGSGPQPLRTPKWRQMPNKDCDHDLFFCSNCFLFPHLRRSALDALITGGDGYE